MTLFAANQFRYNWCYTREALAPCSGYTTAPCRLYRDRKWKSPLSFCPHNGFDRGADPALFLNDPPRTARLEDHPYCCCCCCSSNTRHSIVHCRVEMVNYFIMELSCLDRPNSDFRMYWMKKHHQKLAVLMVPYNSANSPFTMYWGTMHPYYLTLPYCQLLRLAPR